MKTYGALIKKIASWFCLPLSESKNTIFYIVLQDTLSPVSLPMVTFFLQTIHQTWQHLSSAPTSLKRLDHMYRVQKSSAAFLYTHPKPDSIVVTTSLKCKHHSSPPDRDGKTVDTYSRRFYATGALGIKACNYLACMARFLYAIFKDFSAVIPHLPDDLRSRVLQLQSDGLAVARQQVNMTKHSGVFGKDPQFSCRNVQIRLVEE